MKYLIQLAIILGVTFLAEVVSNLLPFNLPVNVLAMVFLLIFLGTKLIKEDYVKGAGDYLLTLIGLFLVPVTVDLVMYLPIVLEVSLQLFIITLITFFLGFVATVYTVRISMRLFKKKEARK